MNYTLHQLQIFFTIAQTKSVTKTAELLHLTQPAISIQLKNFQKQFDIPLTEVVGRQLFVTDFGKEIAHAAEQIIRQVEAIDQKTKAFHGQLTGTLRLSVVSTGKYVMPYFLSEFVKSHPAIEVEMDVTNKSNVIESLQKNRVDFALVSVVPQNLGVEKIDLLQNKLFLVAGIDHGLKGKIHSTRIFKSLPLIIREKGSGTRLTMERFFEQNGIHVQRRMELTSNEAVKQAILSGLGYSIMPIIGLKNELQNNLLQIIPVKGLPITTTWSLLWMKGKNHSPVASEFLHYLEREKQRLVIENFLWSEEF